MSEGFEEIRRKLAETEFEESGEDWQKLSRQAAASAAKEAEAEAAERAERLGIAPAKKPAARKPRTKPKSNGNAAIRRKIAEAEEIKDGGGTEPPEQPPSWVEELNKRYGLMTRGNDALIVDFDAKPLEDYLSLKAFRARYENTSVSIPTRDGRKTEAVSKADAWLRSPWRRNVSAVIFHPTAPDEGYDPGDKVNVWRGWTVEPDPGAGKFDIFRDHVLTNIAGGNAEWARWIWAYAAQMVQKPRFKPGVALVLRGVQGCGKTKFGEVIGGLCRQHHMVLHSENQVHGNHNAHLARALLVQLEETTWGGNKGHEGFLKSMITSDRQIINRKFVDQYEVDSFARFLVTSNSDWPVPVSMGERRFAVFDVSDRCARNTEYFAEMDQELSAGGSKALLAYLMAFDLSSVDLGDIPRTSASLAALEHSFDPFQSWWYGRLMEGTITASAEHWPEHVQTRYLYTDYLARCEERGDRHRLSQVQFGRQLATSMGVDASRRIKIRTVDGNGGTVTANGYPLPSLEECRERFERMADHPIDWPTVPDDPDR